MIKNISQLNKELKSISEQIVIVGKPELSHTKDHVKYWVQKISSYPMSFAHFKRLRWPHQKAGFLTIEYLSQQILHEKRLASKRFICRSHDHDWNALSEKFIGLYTLNKQVERTLEKWYETKTCNRNKLLKYCQNKESKGFPDLIDFHKGRPKCWEIKAPFDSVTKAQIEVLKGLKTKFDVDVNVLLFEFEDSSERSKIQSFRKQVTKEKDTITKNFFESKLRAKLEKFFIENCYSTIGRRLRYQPALGRFHYISSDKKGRPYAVMELNPAFYRSPDEMLKILFQSLSPNFEDVDSRELSSKLPLTKTEINQLSIYFYNMGYYKWWIVPIIFYPYLQNHIKDKKVQELVETALLFNAVFNSKIDIYSLGKYYNKHFDEIVPQLYSKIVNYEQGRLW